MKLFISNSIKCASGFDSFKSYIESNAEMYQEFGQRLIFAGPTIDDPETFVMAGIFVSDVGFYKV